MKPLLIHITIYMCLIGCSRDVYKLQPVIQKFTSNKTIALTQQKFTEGVDFIASGSSPENWSLEMDFEKQFTFKTGTDSFSLLAVPAVSTAKEKQYLLRDRAGAMDIIISNGLCDKDSKKQMVTVTYKNINYSSCGNYLFNQELAGSWEIIALGKNELNASKYKDGLPVIYFNPEQREISATSSCLQFSTTFEVEGRHLRAKNAVATNTPKCKEEKMLIHFQEKILGQWMSYKIEGDKLYFYLIDDSNVTLRKRKK